MGIVECVKHSLIEPFSVLYEREGILVPVLVLFFSCESRSGVHYSARSLVNCCWHHTSHDSVSVVRTTFKVYGKRQTFDPQPTKNPWTDRHQIWMAWLRRGYHQKIGLNPPKGFCSPYRWNIHPYCLKFTTLFWFLNSPTGKPVRPIFTLNTSNDTVLCKEVPFYCYKIKILFFTYLFEQFEKKLQWRLWGKF